MCEVVENLKDLPDAIDNLATHLAQQIALVATAISADDSRADTLWQVMHKAKDTIADDLMDFSNALVVELAGALDGDEPLPLLLKTEQAKYKEAA